MGILNRLAARAAAGALAACALATACAAQSEDATAFQIDAAHSGGIAFAAGFSAPLVKKWSFDTGGAVGYPLIAQGQAYVVSNQSNVYAIDLATGKKKWIHQLGGNANAGAYDNGTLFYESLSGVLTALKTKNGKQAWQVVVDSDTSQPWVVAVNGSVYIGGPAATSVDEKTGHKNWEVGVEGTDSGIAFGDNLIYAGGPTQYYGINPDGSVQWLNSGCCEGGGGINVSYANAQVYLVDQGTGNFVLNDKTGAKTGVFSGNTPPSFYSIGSRSYELEINNGQLVSVNAKTGSVAWTYVNADLSGRAIAINGQPVVAAGSVVTMLDGKKGKVIWQADVGDQITSLTAGDGVLAVGAGNKVSAYVPQ